jgi:signal transduction histidine kinase
MRAHDHRRPRQPVREQERHRLWRDLHDDLGPTLAGLVLQLGAARDLAGRATPLGLLLGDLQGTAQDALGSLRGLAAGAPPAALDGVGLADALAGLADRLRRPGGPELVLEAAGAPPRVPPAVAVAAYRIAGEALANVVRHAGARSCRVRLTGTCEALVLEIRDDGTGLEGGGPPGVGLSSMRARAAELGGSCVIRTRPGGGTLVRAELPLQPRLSRA